jgi:hypothetical protein
VKSGEYVRAKEILFLIFLFVVCFLVTETIISHFFLFGVYRRFFLRVFFLIQYSMLIYFLFDYCVSKKNKKTPGTPPEFERKSLVENPKNK